MPNSVAVFVACFLSLVSAVFFRCLCLFWCECSFSFSCPGLIITLLWCCEFFLRCFRLFFFFSDVNYGLHFCMFSGLPLGFSCARSGSLLPLLSLWFFCVFLLGPKGPYLCPACPPVIIATISISCFAVAFLCPFVYTAWPNSRPQRPPVPLRSSFPWPSMTLDPSIHIPTHKCPPWASIDIPDPLC